MNLTAAATMLLFGLTGVAPLPSSPLQGLALDRPRNALERGTAPSTDPAQRQAALWYAGRAALTLSSPRVEDVALELDRLGQADGLPGASPLADLLRAHALIEREQVKQGLDLAQPAAARLRALNDPYWRALADSEICQLLLVAQSAPQAQAHCERAYAAWPALGREFDRAHGEYLMQWLYRELGRRTEAIALAQSARARLATLGSDGGVALLDDALSSLYLDGGDATHALAAARGALAHEVAAGKLTATISSRHHIARALAALGWRDEALRELDHALGDSRRLELGRLTAQLLDAKARIAEEAGNTALALAASRELIALNARLSGVEVARAVAELEAQYGAEVREREIHELKQDGELTNLRLVAAESAQAHAQSRTRLYALALVASLAMAALLVAVIWLRLRWLKRLNGALSALSRARADMLAMAAHEVRNPLAAVCGLIDMTLPHIANPRLRGLLETARTTSEGLVRTADDYLDHARLALDRVELRALPFDLPHLLSNVVCLFQAEVAGRPVSLTLHGDPRLPTWVVGDAARLHQVLANLLGNAVKFTAAGHVRLDAHTGGDGRIHFAVSDSGPGIDAADIARVLKPFERGDTETGRRGAGLGLAIASQLVDKLGGRLSLDTQPGQGSRFSFSLEFAPAPAPVVPSATAGNAFVRVLLVDDDETIRDLLGMQLESLGVEHRVAATVDEAYEAWRDFAPDTLLVDLHLERESGIDLIRRVRESCEALELPLPRCLIHSASAPYGPHDRPPPDWQVEWVRKPMPLNELGALLGSTARPVAAQARDGSATAPAATVAS
jgi:signal transduction histidine kinase